MIERLKNWLKDRSHVWDASPQDVIRSGARTRPRPKMPRRSAPLVNAGESGRKTTEHSTRERVTATEDKLVIRNRLVREETGTHDSLTILDESMLDTGEEKGIDPYNTGEFDRSQTWDSRFRK